MAGGFGAGAAGVGTPAEYGTRVVAYLIDFALVFAGYIAVLIVGAIFGAINENLGTIVSLIGLLAVIAFLIWNVVIRQGQTGQTIGKEKQGIRLVEDATGQPVGGGKAFVRVLIASALGFLCGIGTLLDYLWPLWDAERKRLTDKILNFSVVQG
jgi:uncharacterized RDD family membrane protein YckC